MPTSSPDPETYLPLSMPVLHILLALAESEGHGYGIIQDIQVRTDGDVTLSTSTLYGAIQRLVRDGMVEKSDGPEADKATDERRRYYRITEFGRQVVDHEARRIERLAKLVRGRRFASEKS